ncbi:hypothetical protein NDU88_010666 [Pleurodeles waltl]|uniref:Uncharacterized protein n=1 Tax=Pleurodeles waltl TaxID=8319 RepID=A0AAV7QY05_PLEWA|nr:hypothetical protein NDU88_010666 [Pleurodeles waltl]
MEPARRALLVRCLPQLSAALPEPHRLLAALEEHGALSGRERRELETSSGGPLLERLLHTLSLKERDTYPDLRAVLENTEPGALRVLQQEEDQEEGERGW